MVFIFLINSSFVVSQSRLGWVYSMSTSFLHSKYTVQLYKMFNLTLNKVLEKFKDGHFIFMYRIFQLQYMLDQNRLFMQTIKLKIVQPLVHHELVIQNGQWIRFYFSGSICRKQFLSIQHLVILNCMYYFSFLNKKTPHTFVRSIYNTCRNFFYFMYCMDVAVQS